MTLLNSDILLLIVIVFFVVVVSVVLFLIVKLMKQPQPKSTPVAQPTPQPQPLKVVDEKQKHLFPLKLQAYEHIVLFMERIEPSSLVMRTKTSDMTSGQLHGALLNNIREEYEHNVAQQIYISDNAWSLVKQAKEETIKIINLAGNSMEEKSTGNDLTRNIFEKMMVLPKSPSQIALDYVKQEVKEII